MKRLWQALAVALCLVMCVGMFAACADGAKQGETDDLAKVTKSEWTAATTFAELTNYTMVQTTKSTGQTIVITMKGDNGKYEHSENANVQYFEESGGKKYQYSKQDDVWSKTEVSQEALFAMLTNPLKVSFSMLPYETLTYQNGVYSVTAAGSSMEIEFKDKKVWKVKAVGEVGGTKVDTGYVVTYGEASVTLPVIVPVDKTVSKEEWEKALSFEGINNYTINQVVEGDGNPYENIQIDYDQNKVKTTNKLNGLNAVNYMQQDGTTYYEYQMVDNVWNKETTTKEQYELEKNPWVTSLSQVPYENATYENGVYTIMVHTSTVKLMFENGKVVEMQLEEMWSFGSNEAVVKTTCSVTYGGASVTLPTIEETPTGEQVTEEEWTAAVSFQGNTTYKVTAEGTIGGETQRATIYRDGDKVLIQNNNETEYYEKAGTRYFIYQYANGKWAKTEIDQQTYERVMLPFPSAQLQGGYQNAVYQNGVYRYQFVDTMDVECNYTILFKNKKISVLTATAEIAGMQMEMISIINYEPVSVTLPTIV